MADRSVVPLLTLGPFLSIDTTTADVFDKPGVGSLGTSANPHRVPGALTAERGRRNLANITAGGAGLPVTAIAPYVPYSTDEWIVGAKSGGGVTARFVYDESAGTQNVLNFGASADTTVFDQTVQFGQTLYDNAGRQYSSLNPMNSFLWHYPPPSAADLYAVSAVGGGTLTAQSYNYAFTKVVTSAPATTAFKQETSEFGADVQANGTFLFSITSNGTKQTSLTGTFSGTNPDGSTFSTNVYRRSDTQPVWFFLANTTGPFTDNASDASIAGNAQLVFHRDPPPCSPTNLGAVNKHKSRTWVFLVVNNADTNNQPQTQLWYSELGRPWEFDKVNRVLLVGDSPVKPAGNGYGSTYGEYPVGLLSFSSLQFAFGSQRTYVVYGDDPQSFVARKIFDEGCQARQSIAVGKSKQGLVFFWLSEHGVQMSDGSAAYYISDPIRSVIDTLTLADRKAAVGTAAHHTYYISFPISGQTWGYYIPTGEWFGPLPYGTPLAFSVPSNPSQFGGTTAVNEVTAIRTGTNFIDQWFVDSDLDLLQLQTVTWLGPLSDSGAFFVEKRYMYVALNAPVQPGVTATVTLTIDPGSTPAKTYTSTPFDLGNGQTTQMWTVPTEIAGNTGNLAQVSVTFTATSPTTPIQIYGVIVGGEFGRAFVPYATGSPP